MTANNAYKKIAKQEGVSVAKVRKEIQLAINEGIKSTGTQTPNYWNSIPRKGTAPTPDEFVTFMAMVLEK